MGKWIAVKSCFQADSEGNGWMEEGCWQMSDRVRGETYCLLENHGPRQLSR